MKVLLAQLNPIIGDLENNFEAVANVFSQGHKDHDLIVFPELTLTGYPPNDLLLRRGFVEEQNRYADKVKKLTQGTQCTVLIGLVTFNHSPMGKPLHNSAVAFRDGEQVFIYHKQLLPTYNIFDENRYFEAGRDVQPNSLTIPCALGKKHTVGVLICEDCWNDEAICDAPLYPTNPVSSTFRKANNIEAIITLNASPSDIGKNYRRYDMYTKLSKKCGVPFVYVNSVGGQDSLIFDGYSFVADGDKLQFAMGYKHHCMSAELFPKERKYSILVPNRDTDFNTFEHLKLGLVDYITKNGFKSVVVGSSGGIDSAVVIALAAAAIGPENVYAVTMPSKYSSEGSVSDSEKLCNNLGVKLFNRPIGNEVQNSILEFEQAFGVAPKRMAIENMQARIRGRILMEFSNHFGSLVLSTGNKSEMSVGYCTIYGDMCGGLSVIADLYKMEVYSLAKWHNQNVHADSIIPKDIIDKAPSAELWEGQKDTDSLPPYPILDAVLRLYLERDLLTHEEIEADKAMIEGMTLKEIKRILKMVDGAEFKRRQAAPVLRVHKRAFGFGRNLPITQRYKVGYENVL